MNFYYNSSSVRVGNLAECIEGFPHFPPSMGLNGAGKERSTFWPSETERTPDAIPLPFSNILSYDTRNVGYDKYFKP